MLSELFTTIIHRPYVFIFLIAYLVIAVKRWGTKTALVWLVTCYFVAWLSEYSSIHNGFPYGAYEYVYENLKGELLIAGVPFFDSLSYSFLIFAGWMLACCHCEAIFGRSDRPENSTFYTGLLRTPRQARSPRNDVYCLILGAIFTMLLDVIIDPVATMGSRWFLGEIHRYIHPGFYFGVPLTNFGGWFLTSLAAISLNLLIWRGCPALAPKDRSSILKFERTIPILFYTGIAIFNIAIALWLKEFLLGTISLIVLSIPLGTCYCTSVFHRTVH